MGNIVEGICIREDTATPVCPKANEHGTCTIYVQPCLANRARAVGGCPFHQPAATTSKTKINPLKASKRAKKGN